MENLKHSHLTSNPQKKKAKKNANHNTQMAREYPGEIKTKCFQK